MRRRPAIALVSALAMAAALAACSPSDETADTQDTTEQTPADDTGDATGDDTADGDEDATGDDDAQANGAEGEDPLADLEDPNDLVEDATFRGAGITMPTPEGWELNQMAYAQGAVLAMPAEDESTQQMLGQAVDVDTLPEPIDFEQLVDANREQFEEEPTVDEEVEIDGAERAHQLSFDSIATGPAAEGEEAGEPGSLTLIVADNGDGRLAIFNYIATVDDYQESTEELLLAGAGFDAGSDPVPPAPAPQQPGPEQTIPEETAPEEPAS